MYQRELVSTSAANEESAALSVECKGPMASKTAKL
jgi:hypothetical protein